jgi:potassium efflux system protein
MRRIVFFTTTAFLILVAFASAGQKALSRFNLPKEPFTTPERIQTFLKDFEEKSDLDEEKKSKVKGLFQDARDYLKLAEEQAAKFAGFEKAQKEAPATLKEITKELARSQETPKPEALSNASLQQLEQHLAQAEAELKAEREKAVQLDEERKNRAERMVEIPNLLALARQKIGNLEKSPELLSSPEEGPELKKAKVTVLFARRTALENEILSYQKEIESYDARRELLTARRDWAARKVSQAEQEFKAWQEIVNERRRIEAVSAAKAAEEARKEAALAHPLMRKLGEENAKWAERRANERLADKIEETARQLEDITKTLARLSSDYHGATTKIETVGLTPAMGMLLRKQQAELPDIRKHRRAAASRQSAISAVQLELIELGEVRSKLADIDSLTRESIMGIEPPLEKSEEKETETAIRELLMARRGYVDSIINDYNSYFVKLIDMDAEGRRLISETEKFREFIRRHVLWIRSSFPPKFSDIVKSWEAVQWLLKPDNWTLAFVSIWRGILSHLLLVLLGLPLVVAMHRVRRRVRSQIIELGEAASKSNSRNFLPTATVILLTMGLALLWPLPIWLVGRLLGSTLEASDFARAVAGGLEGMALAFFTIEIMRQTFRSMGLAQAHFGWPERAVKLFRRQLAWLMPFGLPLVFVISAIDGSGEDAWRNSLGRFSFVAGQFLLVILAHRVFHPEKGVLQETSDKGVGFRWKRLRQFLHPLSVALPLVLAALSLAGYHFTVMELAVRLQSTLWLIFGLVVGNAVGQRWFIVFRRNLAFQQVQKRRAVAKSETGETSAEGLKEAAPLPEIDLSSISDQTRNILRTALGLALVAGLWIVWIDVLPALGILDKFELWTTTQTTIEIAKDSEGTVTRRFVEQLIPITLTDLLFALLVFGMTIGAARNIPGLLEFAILQHLSIRAGERYAITALSRYAITIIGVVTVFAMLGITWSKVQWLAAAVTVGLGFGLQEIFANFVSGLILFFERPIKVDDVVTVGDVEGRVTQINIRATTITDWNRKELIVPNKEFVTGKFINWTLSDPITRIVIPVGVAYGSDTGLALELLLKVATECTHIMEKPRPKAIFKSFGDNALQLELRAFIPTVDSWGDAMNELHTGIDQEFRKAGIEIAFPQRDIHIRSITRRMAANKPK